MRTAKYYAGTERVDAGTVYSVDATGWTQYGLPGQPFPGRRPWVGVMIGKNAAGERVRVRAVFYNPHGSKHKCDARCQNAKGHNCECACGGANHGAGG